MQEDVASTSMRGDISEELRKDGGIKEIRSREIGLQKGEIDLDVKLKIIEYDASEGKEYFLEMVNKDDILFGLLRLRLTKNQFLKELKDAAIVRELHVYGQALRLGEDAGKSQHRGMGKELMAKAEKIARENGFEKIAVISGVGVREYYRKMGYSLVGAYMVKELNKK